MAKTKEQRIYLEGMADTMKPFSGLSAKAPR